ncbi:MAG: rRNA methyltransferase [Schumannella sp.]|nr:rRNA methyltransferase [Schumannella sp.]
MAVVPITDLGDPRLGDFARRTDVDLRRGDGPALYIAESLLVLERALRAGHSPRAVLALGASVDEVLAVLGSRDVPVFTGPGDLLAELTGYLLHRGVVASIARPPLPDVAALIADARRLVVIEDVVDPTNVGAIFRSVAGIGADAVLVTPRTSDPFYRRAIRVSMGTVLQVPWTRAPELPELAPLLRAAGFEVAALALTPEAVSLRNYLVPERVALVLGSEGDGLSPESLAAADVHLRIPMRHGIDSLNVAAAAAVAIYALTPVVE